MPGTETLTGTSYPTSGDAPQVYQHIKTAVEGLADNTIPYFTSTSDRDTKYAAWVTAGNTMRAGLVCCVSGSSLYEYDGNAWIPLRGVVGYDSATAQFNNTGTTEVAVTGLRIDNVELRSGRVYRVDVACRPWAGVGGVVMALRVRVGTTLSVSSTAVASKQIVQTGSSSGTVEDKTMCNYFVVQSNGTYDVGVFGVVASGSFAVGPDATGRYEIVLTDCGPSAPGMRTVT